MKSSGQAQIVVSFPARQRQSSALSLLVLRSSTAARQRLWRVGRFLAEKGLYRSGAKNRPAAWQHWNFSEKVRWRCAHPDTGVRYERWADKFAVKSIVAPYFQCAETYSYVRGSARKNLTLPPVATFVMKATHGWNMCLLVRDGELIGTNQTLFQPSRKLSQPALVAIAEGWHKCASHVYRKQDEFHYALLRPGFMLEALIEPVDYELQFFLFRGYCPLTMVSHRDFYHNARFRHRLYDERWQRLRPGSPAAAACYDERPVEVPRPPQRIFDSLSYLCRDIDQVRADFYVSNGEYIFGEFTFTHARGGYDYLGRHNEWLSRFWT